MRALASVREVPLFYLAKVFTQYRQSLLKIGENMVKQNLLDQADDIFFIPQASLKEWVQTGSADLKAAASDQRVMYGREYLRKQTPRVLLSTGEAFYEGAGKTSDSGNQLAGTDVSPGVVEGIARVILDPQGAHLEPGEILVCPRQTPAGRPYF